MFDAKKKSMELLTQRMLVASVYCVTLQFLFVCCLVLFANFLWSTDHTRWLHTTWAAFTSPLMWTYLLILIIVVLMEGYFCSKICLCTPPYHKSRFTKLCAIFTIQNLLLSGLYVVIGGILVWLYLSVMPGRYNSLIVECRVAQGKCLMEEYFFLLLGGCWSGLYFSIKNITRRYFCSPIIAQSKFFRLRRNIYSMLPTLVFSSTWSTAYYIIAYYFLGLYIQSYFEIFDTTFELHSYILISRLWLHQFFFALTLSSTYLLFEVYMTERVCFKIDTSCIYDVFEALAASEIELSLIDTISMDKMPIIQHLGYLDLVTKAQKEQYRKKLLFTLCQPGSHPYNWNRVVEMCMDLLRNFTSDLNAIRAKLPIQSYMYDNAPLFTAMHKTSAEKPVCNDWWTSMLYLVSKKPINYIFGEQEDNKISYVLLNNQLVIWAAEAISFLAVFSVTEDVCNVVQKNIPTIINVLLSLKQALDKLGEYNMFKKKALNERSTREIFTSLRSAIKYSLYRIIINFKQYVDELYLEQINVQQLHSYLNYK